jgi:predicted AAA+ superfamily ATPase
VLSRRRGRADYRRPIFETIAARVHEERRFIQVLAGPRQVGKTTLARQVMDTVGLPAHFASADDPALREGLGLVIAVVTGDGLQRQNPTPAKHHG